MYFSSEEIDNHKRELKIQIKDLEKEIKDNPLDYGNKLKINNLSYILSQLNRNKK